MFSFQLSIDDDDVNKIYGNEKCRYFVHFLRIDNETYYFPLPSALIRTCELMERVLMTSLIKSVDLCFSVKDFKFQILQ